MNELERMTLITLMETSDVEAASFFKQCRVVMQRNMHEGAVELLIEVPMQKYRIFERFTRAVERIEHFLHLNARKLNKQIMDIMWTGKRTFLLYSSDIKEIQIRASLARYHEISMQKLLKKDYIAATHNARKAVRLICAEIIALEEPGKVVSSLPFNRLWYETKRVLSNQLGRTVSEGSIPNLTRILDAAAIIAGGTRNSDAGIASIKFKTVAAQTSYNIQICFSTAYFLFDSILCNGEEDA